MLNYSKLRELQRSETANAELCRLEEDFYFRLREFLATRKEAALSGNDLLSIKEYENVKKIAGSLVEKRMEKIVLAALRGKGEVAGLTSEEEEFLSRLASTIKENQEKMHGLLEEGPEGADGNIKKIKLLKDITPYKGLDNRTYGPFKSGEVAEVPVEEAKFLLREGTAEML